MAKTDRDLFDTLRARGLRKSAANNLAKAFGRADKSPPSKGAKRAVSELRDGVGRAREPDPRQRPQAQGGGQEGGGHAQAQGEPAQRRGEEGRADARKNARSSARARAPHRAKSK